MLNAKKHNIVVHMAIEMRQRGIDKNTCKELTIELLDGLYGKWRDNDHRRRRAAIAAREAIEIMIPEEKPKWLK